MECKSFLESNAPYILALCETNLDDSIDSGNFSVSGYLHLIRYYSCAWSSSFCERRASFCTGLTSRKLCRFLLMFLTGFTSVFYFFFLYRSTSSCLCTVFYSIPPKIDEVLLINPSANAFVFGDFKVIIWTG